MESITINLGKEQALSLRAFTDEIGLNLEEFFQMLADHISKESEVKALYTVCLKNQQDNQGGIQKPSKQELNEIMEYVLRENAELYRRLA